MEVICCFQDESVEQARQLMAEHNVSRLPVIDRDHHLVGIIKFADIEGQVKPVEKAVKVTFHKDMTDFPGTRTKYRSRPYTSPVPRTRKRRRPPR